MVLCRTARDIFFTKRFLFKLLAPPPPPSNRQAFSRACLICPLPSSLFLTLPQSGDSVLTSTCFRFPLACLPLPSHPLDIRTFFAFLFSYRKVEDALVSLLTSGGAKRENATAMDQGGNMSPMP